MNSRKIVLLFAIMAFSVGFTQNLNAQTLSVEKIENSIKKNGKYAILVQNANHLMAAVMSGEEYKKKSTKIQFQIVLIGAVVKDLATNKELIPFIEKAELLGIRIVVCEFAMKMLSVEKSSYHHSVFTTPNGFSYLFGLQENGFKTIAL